ncbi:dihydroxy-acid dehydratase [Blattabacterium cuenoti]|uniref:dihydroxy-acid dehydratase n=1 Tax=Blattabacterium cuenoti TaxID=1653831 RepID=UPI00163B8582|nr:dihydroxy-acid dehydratase [Blattabacterium cuenoti]
MKRKINSFSRKITNNPNLPAAHAMLYATGMRESDFCKAQIGIVSNWYEGNPCNMHLDILGKKIKLSVINQKNLIGFQFTTIGVSDGITMGTPGMRFSLPSRELIADSIETVVEAHHYDGVIAIPGCDKNMPGVMISLLRLNRPSIIVYGGSISSGFYNEKKLDIVSSFEALGEKNTCKISEEEYKNIIKNSCPGPGSCGGMYTANTMASALEAMGMSLPYSSSSPSTSENKKKECKIVSTFIQKLLERKVKPKDIVTKTSIENGVKLAMCLGGSTNLILHFLAIAKSANVHFTLKDFQKISNQVPLIGNLKPSGIFLMEDIHKIGGTPVIIKYLLNQGILSGDCLTVTGETLHENMKKIPNINFNQKIIYPLNNPIKKNGHIRILYGNLSPEGSVAKITGKEGIFFRGEANVFDSEEDANKAILNHKIQTGEVIVIRYVGPIGGPGMPEMLKPTSYIMGSGLGKNVALITDGRFSGGSHGFVVGHITPEAQSGGLIAFVRNGDFIKIDAENNLLTLEVEEEEIQKRKKEWIPPLLKVKKGYLYKYIKTVSPASEGCVTDQF